MEEKKEVPKEKQPASDQEVWEFGIRIPTVEDLMGDFSFTSLF